MKQPGPHGDQPETACLRLVLIDAIFRTDETSLVLLADVMQACGLLPCADEAEEPDTAQGRPRKATLHTLRLPRADDQ